MNRRDFLRAVRRRPLTASAALPSTSRAQSPDRPGLPAGRRHGGRRPAVPPQQRRLRRQAAAGDARVRLRLPRLRRRRLAGHPARQRHGLARPQAPALDAEALSQQPQRHVHRRHPRGAGLDVEMYGMGVAVGDFNNDGFPDIFVTCVGQNRLFRNTGKGTLRRRHARAADWAGAQAFSTSAMWFDFDRDGLLDLFVCNYVRWSAEHDVFCSLDGKQKSYCTPEAYRGETCWLFRNRGNGTFEDVTRDERDLRLELEIAGRGADRLRPGRLARHLRGQRHAAQQAVSQPAQRHVQGRRRSTPASRSARTARRAPAWASTRPTSTTRAGPGWRSRISKDEMIGLYRAPDAGHYRGRGDCGGCRRSVRAPGSASAACSPISISTAGSISSSSTATSTIPSATSAASRLRAGAATVPQPGRRHVP